MDKILVSGLINIETTVNIESFPLNYCPIKYPFFGVESSVSGVGINVAKALTCLGNKVNLLSLIGTDYNGSLIKEVLVKEKITTKYVVKNIEKTPQSVILYDNQGKRQILLDLKDIQENKYPEELFEEALNESSIAVLCNINFSRPFLKKVRKNNKLVATDVHVLSDIYDQYNAEFMQHSNILFMSDEGIKEPVEDFAKKVIKEYNNDILVIGLGEKGALLYVKDDDYIGKFPAVYTRKIVNTVGAGDALFSCFIHYYNKTRNPYNSLKKAMAFASYKIGSNGAAEGFLNENDLEKLYLNINK